jgi:hypothetical protein
VSVVSHKTLLRGRPCQMRDAGCAELGRLGAQTPGLRNPAAPLSRCMASAQNWWRPDPCALCQPQQTGTRRLSLQE